MNRYDCTYRNDFGDIYRAEAMDDPYGDYVMYEDAAAEIARLTAERDEALDLAVLAVRFEPNIIPAGLQLGRIAFRIGIHLKSYTWDGTDAGILDALRRAREASGGN